MFACRRDHLHLETTFIPTQFIRFEEATIKTDKISKQGIYEEIQKFKKQVREQGKAFYRLTINIDNDKILSTQDILQIREMISEYEENEHDFIVIEDMILNYIQNEETPLINEFSNELINDDKVFEEAMTDLYLNPRASKYLEDYTTFNKAKLIHRAEKILKADMRVKKLIIKSLEIYGYGQFVQRKIELNQTFTEIYGENEAGKSTIQSFIHSILFGFPTKKEKNRV